MPSSAQARPSDSRPKPASGPARAMEKLGLRSDIDLALHLPMRYEDETRLSPIAALRDGSVAQVEGVVAECRIESRPRRQLIVRLRDGSAELVLRFLHFYPSQQKSLAPGARLRVRGEARGGFFGLEMVHPLVKPVVEGSPLPTALTPVYPSSAQLPQAYLRKAIVSALARAPLAEVLPAGLVPPGLPSLREALQFLHHPPRAGEPGHLDGPQPPGLATAEVRGAAGAAAVAGPGQARTPAPARPAAGRPQRRRPARAAARGAALCADRCAAARRPRDRADLAREQPMHRLLQGDVGSGKTVVAALAAALGHRLRLAMRADGADRDPGRAAFSQAGALARTAGRGRGLAHRQPQGQGARRDGRARRQRRGGAGGGHACGDPGRRALRAPGAGDHRRAASLRRAAAAGAAQASSSIAARRQAARCWSRTC